MDSLAQRIEQWVVIAGDRVAGKVLGRPDHRDGASLVTSPVVEVRLMGTGDWSDTYLVAFTESGHFYRLGRPANWFGTAAAKDFIHAKLAEPGAGDRSKRAPASQANLVEATLDTNFQNFDTIELYATSFAPM